MSELGEAWQEVWTEVADAGPEILKFRMTILGPGSETRDADGYVTTADGIVASDIPCDVEGLSSFERMAGGAMTGTASDRIKTVVTSVTMAIQPNQRLKVAALGPMPETTFEVGGLPRIVGAYLHIDARRLD